jgi:hypothetical protein
MVSLKGTGVHRSLGKCIELLGILITDDAIDGSTNISGAGGVFCRRVFGGGFYSSVKETNVTIKAIDCRDIFGGGFMGDVKEATHVIIGSDNSTSGSTTGGPSGTSKFNNSDIHIHGNVYGGNDVSGYVNITAEENGFRDNGGEGSNIKILDFSHSCY